MIRLIYISYVLAQHNHPGVMKSVSVITLYIVQEEINIDNYRRILTKYWGFTTFRQLQKI